MVGSYIRLLPKMIVSLGLQSSRCPDQRDTLTLVNLSRRHFGRHGVSKSQVVVTLAPRSVGSRQIQPFIGQHDIPRHAVAFVIHQTQHALPEWITLDRRVEVQINCGVIGLRRAVAVFVHEAKKDLRFGIAPQGKRRQYPALT